MRPIYVDMVHLTSDNGDVFVWPDKAGADRHHLIAAAREYLSMFGTDIGPGDDCVVEAPALLAWVRTWTKTGPIREHVDRERWEALDGACGCEDLGWYCSDGDDPTQFYGWSTQDADHPEDLPVRWLEAEVST